MLTCLELDLAKAKTADMTKVTRRGASGGSSGILDTRPPRRCL